MAHASWVIPVLLNTVGAGLMSDFMNWSEKQIVERKMMKLAEPDVMSYIIVCYLLSSRRQPKSITGWLAIGK
jgi:hypothetical protein